MASVKVKVEEFDSDRFYGPLSKVIQYLERASEEAANRNLVVSLEAQHGYYHFAFYESCKKCDDIGYTVVCGWCLEGVPHSSCDDTYKPSCDCIMGKAWEK